MKTMEFKAFMSYTYWVFGILMGPGTLIALCIIGESRLTESMIWLGGVNMTLGFSIILHKIFKRCAQISGK